MLKVLTLLHSHDRRVRSTSLHFWAGYRAPLVTRQTPPSPRRRRFFGGCMGDGIHNPAKNTFKVLKNTISG
jgi:hypothetical protein